jgi:hypothetical protein
LVLAEIKDFYCFLKLSQSCQIKLTPQTTNKHATFLHYKFPVTKKILLA